MAEFTIFEKIAQKMKAEAKFLYSSDNITMTQIMEEYGVTELPILLALKTSDKMQAYKGSMTDPDGVEKWVDENSFPVIGNFSILTYKKYTERKKPAAFLFYDESHQRHGIDRLPIAKSQILPFAIEHQHRFSFATIDKYALKIFQLAFPALFLHQAADIL